VEEAFGENCPGGEMYGGNVAISVQDYKSLCVSVMEVDTEQGLTSPTKHIIRHIRDVFLLVK